MLGLIVISKQYKWMMSNWFGVKISNEIEMMTLLKQCFKNTHGSQGGVGQDWHWRRCNSRADRVWICASPVLSSTNHSLTIKWFRRDYIAWSLASYILNLDICLLSTALWDFICLELRFMCCCKNMYTTTTTTSKHQLSKVRVPISNVDIGRTSRQWLFRSDRDLPIMTFL